MSEQQGHFKRAITLFDAIMLVTGSMIGSGIFIVSADIARQVGSAGWLLVVWLVTGFITMAGAISYGELASMFPKVGGQYVYLREAFGRLTAFLYGWTLFLVIQTGVIAAVAVAFAKFTGVLIPWFSVKNLLFKIGPFDFSSVQLLAIILIVAITAINARGVQAGKLIQNVLGSTKLIALGLLILLGVFFGINSEAIQANFADLWTATRHAAPGVSAATVPISGSALLIAIGMAMTGSLFSSDSWNNIGFAGEEIQNPERTLVRSMAIGTAIVTALYILINIVYLLVLPLAGSPDAATIAGRGIMYATDDRVATAVAESVLGPAGAYVLAVLIMLSTFGANNGIILSGARAYFAMAKDGLFFPGLAQLNGAGVPGRALWVQCLWACLLCLSGSYGQLLNYVMFSVILFYVVTIIGIFVLRRTRPDAPRPYRAWGYPVVPLLYVLLASTFCVILLIAPDTAEFSRRGLLLVAVGVPVYFLFGNRFARKQPVE
ncbi:amino acid/polyamine/organocation transporter, APC superfamily [Hymenobacter daecheongensis DSM 21074]|uniref:Amino acid/polyamine/organocation transporter, APC superfamily n=1 Tax=Hymenobacter daecheongensis DSM 21074 TaxID=1121955 RepID=A0A1M6E7Z1_9BACT|nr:amino acid permease [Hymenobacter daecheongensis]SHI81561.1 amino acid/polyamine/organocation transporter, APC superfamily [Hymenobacter daecheongensis DSM 21074]